MNSLKKIFNSFKEWMHPFFENIGIYLSMIFAISFIVIIGRFLLYNSKICWLYFLICPFLAFTNRKGLSVIIYCTFFLSLFCTVAIVGTPKHIIYAESIFVKGHQWQQKYFVEESTDDEGNYHPGHDETQYNFTPNTDQPAIYIKVIENLLNIFPLLNLGIVYFILRKRLFR